MTTLGVFRDDFYNASSVLPQAATAATTQNGGTLLAANMVGGGDQYVLFSGQTTAQAITTDTAVNIIAQLQQAVAVAYKAQIAGFGQSVQPPLGVPNLFNVAYTLTLVNNNTSVGAITLTAGSGVTIAGTAWAGAITTTVTYVVTVTSPTTVTLTRVGTGLP
jgi:hypothetical protein